MKNNHLILNVIAAGAVLLVGYLLTRKAAAATTQTPAGSVGASGSPDLSWGVELPNAALPGQPGWGWKYYAGGVAIGPDGAYYLNGQRVWG